MKITRLTILVLLAVCSRTAAQETSNDPLLQSVITATLTMQRLSWEHATAAQALYELGRFDLAGLMARDSALRQRPDGAYDGGSPTDVCAIGEVMVRMGDRLQDEGLRQAVAKNRHFMLQTARRAPDGTLYHVAQRNEIWVDSLFMAPPVLAAMGEFEAAIANVRGIRRRLWNPEARLFHHQWDDEAKSLKNAALWGVGNGWALMGMLRTAALLPPKYATEKKEIVDAFRAALDGCLRHLRPDGLTHYLLPNTTTFVDSGAPCTIAYSIYRAIQYGWIPRAEYLGKAELIRQAVRAKVDTNGFLQDACGLPGFRTQSRSVETQGFFILMEAARRDLRPSADSGR
jgi:hypothetical protein